MAGPGAITVASAASVTSPSSINLTIGTAASNVTTPRGYGVFDTVYLPSIGATLHLNGIGLNWHSIDNTNYTTGILGVALANVATPTAAKATSVITFTAATNPQDGDYYYVWNNNGNGFVLFKFKTTLPTTYDAYNSHACYIKLGAGGTGAQNLASTISNIQTFVLGTGTSGTTYFWGDATTTAAQALSDNQFTVSATTANTLTYQATIYGTAANSWQSVEVLDTGGTWAIAAWSGGTNGTGTAPASGTYKYRYSRVRNADQAISYASPQVSATQSADGNINLTSFVAAPTRDAVDFYRWDRTTNGGSVFYRGADVAVGTGEPFVDSYSDATITGAFAVKYDDRIYRPYTDGYPVKCKVGTLYKGRVFMGGASLATKKSAGTVTATNASYTVTFTTPAHITVDWIGRTFKVSTDVQTYQIVDVSESGKTATLNLPYNGTGGSGLTYSVVDDRNPLLVYYSEPLLPNNYPSANSILGISSQDPSGISGMKAAWDSLVVWTQTSVHRIIGDTGSGFRALPVGDGMGAFCNQTIVNVEGILYWLGKDGIYRWGGSGDPQSISNPEGNENPQKGIKRTIDRLNVAQRDMMFANYNPSEQLIRWWVALDGSTTNRDVIVYDLQTGEFSMDTADDATCAATVVDTNTSYRTLVGNNQGGIFQLDVAANSDGVFGIDRVQSVSSYATATNKITLVNSVLPTTNGGIVGCPIIVISAADGSRQRATCSANTSSVITLSGPITAPTAGDQVIVGGIEWRIRTGRWDLEQAFVQRGLPAITTTCAPSTGQIWCAAGKDNDEPTVYSPGTVRGFSSADVFDTSLASGYKLWWHRKGKCRRLCVEFFGFTLGSAFGLVGWIPTVAQSDTVGG